MGTLGRATEESWDGAAKYQFFIMLKEIWRKRLT